MSSASSKKLVEFLRVFIPGYFYLFSAEMSIHQFSSTFLSKFFYATFKVPGLLSLLKLSFSAENNWMFFATLLYHKPNFKLISMKVSQLSTFRNIFFHRDFPLTLLLIAFEKLDLLCEGFYFTDTLACLQFPPSSLKKRMNSLFLALIPYIFSNSKVSRIFTRTLSFVFRFTWEVLVKALRYVRMCFILLFCDTQ